MQGPELVNTLAQSETVSQSALWTQNWTIAQLEHRCCYHKERVRSYSTIIRSSTSHEAHSTRARQHKRIRTNYNWFLDLLPILDDAVSITRYSLYGEISSSLVLVWIARFTLIAESKRGMAEIGPQLSKSTEISANLLQLWSISAFHNNLSPLTLLSGPEEKKRRPVSRSWYKYRARSSPLSLLLFSHDFPPLQVLAHQLKKIEATG